MRGCKVRDVDIVADRRAVRRIIVIAKNCKVSNVSLEGHHGPRDEMGFALTQFTNFSRLIGPASIEIAQTEGGKAVRTAIIGQNALDHKFGRTVSIYRLAAVAFGDRRALGVAINRSGRREHQTLAAGLTHGVKES